jgi:hypothetical protein
MLLSNTFSTIHSGESTGLELLHDLLVILVALGARFLVDDHLVPHELEVAGRVALWLNG